MTRWILLFSNSRDLDNFLTSASLSRAGKQNTLPADRQEAAFFACWTRKEAYIKAKGDGLALGLGQFDVSLAPGEPAALLRTEGDPAEASRWSLEALDVSSRYAAALCVEGHGWRLACWQWTGETGGT